LKTLSGEDCRLVPAKADPVPGAIREDAALSCGGRITGNVASIQLPGVNLSEGAAGQQALKLAAGQLRQFLAPQRAYACDLAKPVPGVAGTMLFACRQNNDGWPIVVLARLRGGRLTAISGPASAWPALKALVGIGSDGQSLAALKQEISAFWSRPIVIASAGDQARIQSLRDAARLSNSQFAFAAAEQNLREALDLQVRLFGEADVNSASILMDLAVIVANQGRWDEADRLLQRAGPIIDRSPQLADRAKLSGYLASVLWMKGDRPRAFDAARSAVAQWRTIAAAMPVPSDNGADPLGGPLASAELAMALNREAGFLLQDDDPVSANARASEAVALLDKAEDAPRWWKAEILANLGLSSISLGRIFAGESYFKAAIDIRRKYFGEDISTMRMQIALAQGYQAEGLSEAAIIAFRNALVAARKLPRSSAPFKADDLVPFAAAVVQHSAGVGDPKARQGLLAEAFDAFQMASVPGRDQAVLVASQRLAASSPRLADLLRRAVDEESARAQVRGAIAAAEALPPDEQDPALLEKLGRQLKDSEARAAAVKKNLALEFPDFAALQSPPLPTLDAVRTQLRDGEGLVTFLIGRKASYVQLVKRSGLTLAPIPAGEEELRDAVRTLRHGLEIEGKAVADFDLAASHRLFSQLFGNLADDLVGLRRLIVVPTGPLASIPFEVLVSRPGRAGDYAGSRWLVQDLAITHTPSLASFISLRSTRLVKSQPYRLLAIADPAIGKASPARPPAGIVVPVGTGSCAADGAVPRAAIAGLNALPDTRQEVQAVGRAIGGKATLLTGGEANEPAFYRQSLSEYRILYFATHGLIPGELACQSEAGLVLTPPAKSGTNHADDGMLSASEIAGLNLHADLVVLSACNTAASAGSGQSGGEALSGLAQAFFRAGARNLVVTHWQVPSAATTQLMSNAFAAMQRDTALPIDEALRKAQVAAIGDRAKAHPFFWGAFEVLGDGAAAPLEERAAS
jgi:CHAT domain-containing protein